MSGSSWRILDDSRVFDNTINWRTKGPQHLVDGSILYDQSARIEIKQLSHNSSSAQIQISPLSTTCVKKPPILSVAFDQLVLINNDPPACGSSTFQLTYTPPSEAVAFLWDAAAQTYSTTPSPWSTVS